MTYLIGFYDDCLVSRLRYSQSQNPTSPVTFDRRCINFNLQRENEAKEREMRDLEAFVKKENAERKKETRAIEEAR